MKRPPTGGTRNFALPREAPKISPKASIPDIAKPFPRKMSVASQPSTIAASTNAGTWARKQEMSQPGRVQAMSTKIGSADVKGVQTYQESPRNRTRAFEIV
ncbi:MAG: hypothetical protein M1836_002300 [Candelina mexicana]|nr:MAG: hypothetical protein M1836_002300 [Candelina mexicana]